VTAGRPPEANDVTTRILLLGPVPPETLAALEALPGGATILPPADAHELLSRIAAEQPDLVVEGAHSVDWAGSASLLHQILESEFARAVRYRHSLSILLIGVDGVDGLAATHGADAVDRFRAALAEALRRSLRQIDVVARTGSNEIAVLLPETTAAGARIVAERTRALASRLIVKSGQERERKGLPIKASVSVGLCDAPRDGLASAAEFLAAAREARHRAENGGGDRVDVSVA
jgi:diguanylate cyclase (GGDEF)-like protein